MTNIEQHYILFTGTAVAANSATDVDLATTIRNCVLIDTSKFVNPTIYFEATIRRAASGNGTTVTVYDMGTSDDTSTAGSAIAGSAITTTNSSYTRIRSSSFSITSGNRFKLKLKNATASATAVLSGTAKIIIVDNIGTSGASWTTTEIPILMSAMSHSNATISYTEHAYPSYYTHDSSKYDGNSTLTAYFEADIYNSNASYITTAELYNITDSTSVTTVTTQATTATRVRSSSFTYTTGKQYVVRLKTSNVSGTAYCSHSYIILQQTVGSGQIYQSRIPIYTGHAATTTSTSSQDSGARFYYDSSNWPTTWAMIQKSTHKISNASYNCSTEMYDGTSTLNDITTTSTGYVESTSSGLTCTTAREHRIRYHSSNASATATQAVSYLIMDVSIDKVNEITITTNSRFKGTSELTKTSNARFRTTQEITKTSNALFRKITITEFTSNLSHFYSFADSYQKKVFYIKGRWWVFYIGASNIEWKTSTDNSTWTSAQTLKTGTNHRFDIRFDGRFFHYYLCDYSVSRYMYYRRGEPDTSGNISWSASEQTYDEGSGNVIGYPVCAIDSEGYTWVSLTRNLASAGDRQYVSKNPNRDGTLGSLSWTELSASVGTRSIGVYGLTAGKLMAIIGEDEVLPKYKLYNGSSWDGSWSNVAGAGLLTHFHRFDASVIGDTIHFLWSARDTNTYIRYCKYSGGSWGSTIDVKQSDNEYDYGHISINPENGDIYAVWSEYTAPGNLCYAKLPSGSSVFSSQTVLETGCDYNARCPCNEVLSANGTIGIAYQDYDGANYDLKFITIETKGLKATSQQMFLSDARFKKLGNEVTKTSDAKFQSSLTTYEITKTSNAKFDSPDRHWLPTSGNLASTNANWEEGTAPSAGKNIHFEGSKSNGNCTYDIATSVGAIIIGDSYSGTITQTASYNCTSISMSTGTYTGTGSYTITCSGNATKTGGTVTSDTMNLIMTGEGATMSFNTDLHSLRVSASISANSVQTRTLTVDNGKTFTITTLLWVYYYGTHTFSNSGTITGATLSIFLNDANKTITFGTVNSNVVVQSTNSATADRTLSLANNATLGGTLEVSSAHASYTTTLSHGSNYTLSVSGTTTVGTRGIMMQGTGTWTFASLIISGASSAFEEYGTINCTSFSISNGYFINNDVTYWLVCSGSCTQSGSGIITNNAQFSLEMSGTGSTNLSLATLVTIAQLKISGSGGTVTVVSPIRIEWRGLTINSNCTLHLDADINYPTWAIGQSIYNSGTMEGTGTYYHIFEGNNIYRTYGVINCPIVLCSITTQGADWNTFLNGNTSFGSNLTIQSGSATYALTLTTASNNYTLSVAGLTTLGTKGKLTQGTGTFNLTGGLTLNGTGAVFTEGGAVSSGDVSVTVGTLTGNASYTFTCTGNLTQTVTTGIITQYVLKLDMTGSNKTLTVDGSWNLLLSLTFSNDTNITATPSNQILAYNVSVANSKTVTIASGKQLLVAYESAGTYSNSGTIGGAGQLIIFLSDVNKTITFGTVNCNVFLDASNGISANRTLSLGTNTSLGGTLLIQSEHATNTLTLLHGTNYTLSVTGLTTLGTRGRATSGTGTWTLTGGLTVNGTSALFTQGGTISSGAVTATAGTLTPNASYTWTCSGNWADPNAIVTANTLNLIMTGNGTSYQNMGDNQWSFRASNNCSITGGIFNLHGGLTIDGGYTLTLNVSVYLELYSGSVYSNGGTLAGSSSLLIRLSDVSPSITFGTVNCPIAVLLTSGASSRTLSLGANAVLGSTLDIYSTDATNTITLSHGTNYTLSVTGLTTLGARGLMTGGTGLWTFTGGLTVNGTGAVFTQSNGNVISGTVTITTGTLTGDNSLTWTCSGNWVHNSGTVTSQTVNLIMTGASATVSSLATLAGLRASNNISIINQGFSIGGGALTIDSGKVLTITGSGVYIDFRSWNTTLSNSGEIASSSNGYLMIRAYSSSPTITFGTISSPVTVVLDSSAVADRTISLGANTVFGSTLIVKSDHATYTCTLSHGTNYTLSVTGLTTLDVRGKLTQGTGTWSLNGGLTQSGASSYYTLGGTLNLANFTGSAGTFQGNTSYFVNMTGAWVNTGTSLIYNTVKLKFITTETSINQDSDNWGQLHTLQASVDLSVLNSMTFVRTALTIDSGITITISGASAKLAVASWATTVTNSGHISCASGGFFAVYFHNSLVRDYSWIPTIEGQANLQLILASDATGDYTLSLVAHSSIAGNLWPYSYHGTYKLILDCAGYNYGAKDIVLHARTVILGGEGTITLTGNWDSSLGVFTCETSTLKMTTDGTSITGNGTYTDAHLWILELNGTGTVSLMTSMWLSSSGGKFVNNGMTLYMVGGVTFAVYLYGYNGLYGTGTIGSDASANVVVFPYTFGDTFSQTGWTFNCNVQFEAGGTGRTITFISNVTTSKNLHIKGYTTCDCYLGSYTFSCVNFTLSDNSGFIVHGETSHMIVSGSVYMASPSFDKGTCLFTLTGSGKTFEMNSPCSNRIYSLTIDTGASYQLLTDLYYSGTLTKIGTLDDNGHSEIICYHSITKTSDAKFATGTTTKEITKTSDVRFFVPNNEFIKYSNARFKKTNEITKTTDSRFKRTQEVTVLSNARFKKLANELTKTTDSKFKFVGDITKTSNARFKKTNEITKTVDNRFKRTQEVTKTTDERFKRTQETTKTLDARFKKLANELTKTSDAKFSSISTQTIDKLSNARFKKTQEITITTNTHFNPVASEITKLSNARFKISGIEITKTSNARFKKTNESTKTLDARFKKLGAELTKTTDARFKKLANELTKTSDSRFKKIGNELTKISDAKFQAGAVYTYTIDKISNARFKGTLEATKTSNARFRTTNETTKLSNARFRTTGEITKLTNSRFLKINELTKTSNSRFKATNEIIKTSNARFKKLGTEITKTSNAKFGISGYIESIGLLGDKRPDLQTTASLPYIYIVGDKR